MFYPKIVDDGNFNGFEFAKQTPLQLTTFLFEMGAQQAELVFESENVQKLLSSNEKFDAVIVELFAIDSLIGFGQHLDCPVIGVNTFDGVYWNDVYTGNETPFAYIPMAFLDLPEKMTFSQRLTNTIYSQVEKLIYNFYNLRNHRKLYEKYFPKATKSFDEVHKSLSVLFMNNHVSTSSPRPLLPSMIGIGGIHIPEVKPLPEDIKKFLDSAADGAILFSMGSFVQSVNWSQQQREIFIKTFSKLKQKVLWKYENETLPGKVDNIMIGSWIPQRDIIAHPNVKLFITHGGSLGTTEAVHEGVPLLGIPLFGDQMVNMKRAVARGYALTLDYKNITEENLSGALNELLTNPKFNQKAKKFSKIFKDRPLNPKQTVVYWTEHVIRQEGADYLKSSGRHMNFIEFHLIDVYTTLAVGIFGFFYIFYIIFKVFKKIFKSTKKQKKQ